jgi:hypothetical protein
VDTLPEPLSSPIRSRLGSRLRLGSAPTYPPGPGLAAARGKFKTDGMDPRPLIHGLAMGPGCAEQHPNEAKKGPKWKLQRSGSTWRKMCSLCAVGWQRASGDAPATEACAGGRQCVGCRRAAVVRIEASKNLGKAASQNLRRGPNRRELEANMLSVVHARNKPAKKSANFARYLPSASTSGTGGSNPSRSLRHRVLLRLRFGQR